MHTRNLYLAIAAVGIVLASAACTRHEVSLEVKPVGVTTVEVRPQSLASAQRYSATLDAAESAPLGFATLGTVKKVYVREGQHVGKGTLLAEVDNEQARSAYAAAKATLDQAEDAYQRTKPLYEKGVIAKIKWIDIETKMQQAASAEAIARRTLGDTRLTSPCAGYVADLGIEPGQQVVAGVPAMRIVNPDRIKAEFSVPEREVTKFGVGMPLLLSVAALDGGLYEATVSEVGMVADRLSRTYKVCATLPNADHALRVGMLGEVWCAGNDELAIAVPTSAVQLDADGGCYVWVVQDGCARKQRVVAGAYVGEQVVVEGLPVGSRLIVKGQQKVSNGMKVEEQ